jgi:O-antigen/teichoic acid export membrane protein
MLQSILTMRFLDPHAYGVWVGVSIVLQYTNYAHAGLLYGQGIRLPFYRAQGDEARVSTIQDSVYAVWTVVTVIFAVGVALYGVMTPQANPVATVAYVCVALLAVLSQQIAFFSSWQVSAKTDFKLGSVILVVQSVCSVIVTVGAAYFFGVRGVMIGSVIVSLVATLLWRAGSSYRFRGYLSRAALADLLRVGLPVLVVVLAGMFIQTIDRIIVLRRLGAEALGFYSVTSLGGSFLYGLLSQAGSAVAPHISAERGGGVGSASVLAKYLVRPTLIFAGVSALIITLLVAAVPVLVTIVLPHYLPGLNAFYWFVPGFLFLGITLTANNILCVVYAGQRRMSLVVGLQIAAVAVEAVVAWVAIGRGFGIAGAAFASTLAYAVYGVSLVVFAACVVIEPRGERRTFLASVAVPVVYTLIVPAAAVLLARALVPVGGARQVVLQAVLLCAAGVPLGYWLERRAGIVSELAEMLGSLVASLAGRSARRRRAGADPLVPSDHIISSRPPESL